jgi:hypothetical protein
MVGRGRQIPLPRLLTQTRRGTGDKMYHSLFVLRLIIIIMTAIDDPIRII